MNREKPAAVLAAATMLFLAACAPASTAKSTPTLTTTITVGRSDPWILYQWFTPTNSQVDELWLVRPDGSGNHPLLSTSTDSLHPDWSPDGQQIAFIADRGDRSDLWMVNADGTSARRLVTCDAPCNTVNDPSWSPDGRKILFGQDNLPAGPGGVPTSFEFKVIDLASGVVTTLYSGHAGSPVEEARWSPDGRHIVFKRGRLSASGDEIGVAIFVMDLAGGRQRQLTPWDSFAQDPDWGPGGWIVFGTYGFGDTIHPSNLFLIKPDGTGLTPLTTFRAGAVVGGQPRWTPDGSAVVFVQDSCRDGTPISVCIGDPAQQLRQLAIIRADGTGLGLATPTGTLGTHPEFRPLP